MAEKGFGGIGAIGKVGKGVKLSQGGAKGGNFIGGSLTGGKNKIKGGMGVDKVSLSPDVVPQAADFGIKSDLWNKVSGNKDVMGNLQSLDLNVVKGYKDTPMETKQNMVTDLNKDYPVGFSSIKGKDAVVKGRVWGVDVFKKLEKDVDKKLQAGSITPAEAENHKKAIGVLHGMSPEQRSSLINLMEQEVAAAGQNIQ